MEKEIESVCRAITELFAPQKIIIYNRKTNPSGRVSSFKLCAVIDTPNTLQCESEIYARVECDLPFDVLVYTPGQWQKFSVQADSFAARIVSMGVEIYGQE